MQRKGSASTGRGEVIRSVAVGSVRIAKLASPEQGLVFEPEPVDPTRSCITFVLQLIGTATCEQQGRWSDLAPGQWDAFETAPLSLTAHRVTAEHVVMVVPRAQLERLDLTTVASRRSQGASPLSKVLCHAASVFFHELPGSDSTRLAEVADPLLRWLRLAVNERLEREPPAASANESVRRRALQYISTQLRDPQLSVESIARELGCTPRYLQKVFQGAERSLSNLIRDHRLNRCYSDLLDPAMAHRSITELALSWGFNSVTHFSDAFRNRFGMPPSIARRMFGATGASEPPVRFELHNPRSIRAARK